MEMCADESSMTNSTHKITELLKAWNDGDNDALDKLMPLVDDELKAIARSYMHRERPGHILQPTALVNEALIRLIRENVRLENRKQFYGFVAKRMRQVLVDYVREQSAAKRGKRPRQVDVVEVPEKTWEKPDEVLMLDAALTKLASINERLVTIVECRFFVGLTLTQTAELLGVGPRTVERDWEFARAWLKREMTNESSTESGDPHA